MDILYTDTWLDMEFFNDPAYQERKAELMKKMLPYQLNSDFIGESKAIVLHDMPMHVGFEISDGGVVCMADNPRPLDSLNNAIPSNLV